MKVLSLLTIFLLSSCGSTRIAQMDIEHCATEGRNFVPVGVNSGTSSSAYYNYSTNQVVTGQHQSRNLICGKSEEKYETCLSKHLKESGLIINKYNEGTQMREFWTGMGYIFIVPGIAGMFINNHNNAVEMEKVTKIRNDALVKCEQYKPKENI